MDNRSEREQIAYHEAGHAIVAWTFGLEIKRVSIDHTEESRGVTGIGSWDGVTEFDEDVLRAHALTALAGEVAVEVLTGTAIDWGAWLDHPGSDVKVYNEWADRLGWYEMDGNVRDLRPVMEKRVAEVRNRLVERWAAVEALAAALLREKEVSGEDAVRIMAETGAPDPEESVWIDFLEEHRTEDERRARSQSDDGESVEPVEVWRPGE